jgi:hypothetical protein
MQSLSTLSRILVGLLILGMGVDLAAAVSDWSLLQFIDRAAAGEPVSEEEGEEIDARQGAMAIAQIGVFLACAIAFLIWFHHAHRNLSRGGLRRLSYSPGWAVGGFFVPFLNLVRPFQVMKEVFSGSVRLAEGGADGPPESARSPLVGLWWAAFLIMGILGNVSGRLYARAEEIDSVRTAATLMLASDCFDVLAAIIAAALVLKVTNLQENALRRAAPEGEPASA